VFIASSQQYFIYLFMRHVIYPTVCLLRTKISHNFKYRIKKKTQRKFVSR